MKVNKRKEWKERQESEERSEHVKVWVECLQQTEQKRDKRSYKFMIKIQWNNIIDSYKVAESANST